MQLRNLTSQRRVSQANSTGFLAVNIVHQFNVSITNLDRTLGSSLLLKGLVFWYANFILDARDLLTSLTRPT